MKNFIVTGTDTDAGKTYVSCLLIRSLRQSGVDIVGYKPVACGDRQDPRKLREAGPAGLSLEQINPVYLKNATSPYVAACLENTVLDMARMYAGYQALANEFPTVLVEGVGGWEVPMTKEENFSDFAAHLGLPLLLVVNNKLGVLNHAFLTIQAIKARGLTCAGIVFNNVQDEWDIANVTNRAILEERTGLPVLAELIHGQDYLDVEPFIQALS
ncbi:MAG: dethiobiotin synthase [Akkermansia sp.]